MRLLLSGGKSIADSTEIAGVISASPKNSDAPMIPKYRMVAPWVLTRRASAISVSAPPSPLLSARSSTCESTGVRGRTVTLKVKFADFQVITRSHTRLLPLSDRSALATISPDLLAVQFLTPTRAGNPIPPESGRQTTL